jgi:hypothetical protein
MKDGDEKMILLATSIAMELSSGLDMEQLEDLRTLINQISCSLNNLIYRKSNQNSRNRSH